MLRREFVQMAVAAGGTTLVARRTFGGADFDSAAMRSRVPPDIVLDYNYETGHLHNGAGAPLYPRNADYWTTFCRELRRCPPELLMVGKEAPFTHSLGPIASYGGENQTFPALERKEARYRLTPEQLRLRIAAIRHFTAEVHAAGVQKVAPYVSLVTLFGDPQQRNGKTLAGRRKGRQRDMVIDRILTQAVAPAPRAEPCVQKDLAAAQAEPEQMQQEESLHAPVSAHDSH